MWEPRRVIDGLQKALHSRWRLMAAITLAFKIRDLHLSARLGPYILIPVINRLVVVVVFRHTPPPPPCSEGGGGVGQYACMFVCAVLAVIRLQQ